MPECILGAWDSAASKISSSPCPCTAQTLERVMDIKKVSKAQSSSDSPGSLGSSVPVLWSEAFSLVHLGPLVHGTVSNECMSVI